MKKKYNGSAAALAAFSVVALALPFIAFAAGPAAINLGTAGNFVLLAKTGISTTGSTVVVGDIGVSPAAATSITGFSLNLTAGSAYSTSPEVSGKVYAPGYADPTAATLTAAIGDMQTAYTDGAGRTNPTATELGAGNIGGLTIAPGLYTWGTGVSIPSDVTLSGGANDVWIFQIAQTLTAASGVHIVLTGGAQASNVYWVVAGQTTIGTTAVFNGTILDQTAVVLNTGAQLNGRALAQSAVTLDSNSVTASAAAVPATPVTAPASVSGSVTTTTNSNGTGSSASQSTGSTASVTTPAANTTTNTNTATVSPAAVPQIRTVMTNFAQGNSGTGVTILQQFLISQNKGSAAQALGAVGATGYFGVLTRAALAEFQSNTGISPALGNFGPITRSYVSAHY